MTEVGVIESSGIELERERPAAPVTGALAPRWGQPWTGIVSIIAFTAVALGLWYVFSDPRGPVGAFPYPFVMYLAMMILVGLFQHMFLGDWPVADLAQPMRGIVQTIMNVALVWFIIHIVFYRVLGLGFNFLSQSNLNALAAAGAAVLPNGASLPLAKMSGMHLAQSAVVCFVLIGFFSYPFVTILFDKWPVRPSNLTQPQAGLLEIAWCSFLTLFFYTVLIVPFWGLIYEKALGAGFGLNTPWWGKIAGINHLHWVFGWWEWMIVILFMTANVWRMKPWSSVSMPQPLKGLFSFFCIVGLGYLMALLCIRLAPMWLPGSFIEHLKAAKPHDAELLRFLWYHAAEIAGFTLIPFLAWHHYFDDMVPMADIDGWGAFVFRTVGVLVFCAVLYVLFYYGNMGEWALGNPHWEHKFLHGESLVWNFWWIIPLLFNEWFFHKWPFYVHKH
jgi:amino acid transporter, AAT family